VATVKGVEKRPDVVFDARCEADFPARRSAVVEIEMKDSRRLRRYQPHRKGDPEEPLSDAELTGKFFELTTPVLGRKAAEGLLAALWSLERQPHVRFEAARLARAAE
jgi:2-methylcitrate dehydratase PrpD